MSSEESPVKKQKTKFTPRPGLTITLKPIDDIKDTTPVLETPIVNHDNNDNKRELIENIKKLRSKIVDSKKAISEIVNNYIKASFSFFQGTKIGYRTDEDKLLAEEIKDTIDMIEKENLLDSTTDENIVRKYNAIKKGISTRTFGGSKSKKSKTKINKKIKMTIRKKNKLIGGGGGYSSFSNSSDYKKKYIIEFGKSYNEKKDEDITKLYMISEYIHEDKEPQLILEDGKYYGDIKDNERNGQGVMKYTNGDEYIGNWENNKRNGMGIMKWRFSNENPNQNDPGRKIYVGEFKDDDLNGHGKLKYNNDFTYIGKWKDGMRNGYGLVYNKKKHFIGDWSNNIFVNGTIYTREAGFMGDPNSYYIVAHYFKNGEIIDAILETNMYFDKKSMEYYL